MDFPNLGSIVVKLNSNNLYLHNGGDLIFALNKKMEKLNGNLKMSFLLEEIFPSKIIIY